ncbi:hypothetical protein ACIBG8_24845 [Nonomuraea sp. NPDC050556]|uniref:hypothetical protein n=1 Tax=Nonomuraea sp. NPDC050556 TaxID=3364369 RepID=UPI0037AD03B2
MGFPKKRETDTKTAEATEAAEAAPRRSEMWSPYDEGPRSRGPLLFVIGGVVVLGLLIGGLVWMMKSGSSTPSQQTAQRSSAPLPSGPPGKYGYAESRTTDPEALTVKEVFGKEKFTVDGRTYTLTTSRKDKKCDDGTIGGKLHKALKAGKCTQLLRASFRDTKGDILGTVAVANLKDTKTAAKVASSASDGNYVKPLPGKDKMTKYLGSGSGAAHIWSQGHYAVLVWFQFKDGKKPDKKSGKQLSQAADDVTKQTAFPALDLRVQSGQSAG